MALWGLYRIGWHLHRAYCGKEELRAVRGEIERLLAQELEGEYGRFRAEALAAEVLGFWEGAGLLDVYRLAGQEWLAFRHLTFQEYGAARALAEMHRDDAEELWQCLSPHLLRPQWAGLTSLVLAHLPGALATTLVERLLAANAGDEDRQRPLFLAAAALAEGAEVADAPHRRVVDALLNLAKTRSFWGWSEEASAGDAVSALGWLGRAEELLTLARDGAMEARVRVWAAEALGRLGRATEVLAGLRALAEEPGTPRTVRRAARKALERLEG